MKIAKISMICLWILVSLGLRASVAQTAPVHKAPVISHDPVKVAVRGQPLAIIANVKDDADAVKSVFLYYTLSRNAAPFKSEMQSSGAQVYYGSIPQHLLSGTAEIAYYIEAIDHTEEMSETPWYTVVVKEAQPSEPVSKPAPKAEPKVTTPVQPSVPAAEKSKKTSLLTVGLIAGGAAALVGGAVYLANRNSSSDDNGDDDKAGTYVGMVRQWYTVTGQDPIYSEHDARITIDHNGLVTTETLHPGTPMQAQLSGSGFLMVADIDEGTNRTGQVNYLGTVLETEIVGSISGTATEPAGEGLYDGTFSALKQ